MEYLTSIDSSNSITIVTEVSDYTFVNPTGNHLDVIQSQAKDASPIRSIAIILSALSKEPLAAEYFLGLDAELLLALGDAVTSHFRVFNIKAV